MKQLNNTCWLIWLSPYIRRMLWRVRNSRGRPKNAPAAFIQLDETPIINDKGNAEVLTHSYLDCLGYVPPGEDSQVKSMWA
jgi:hypothetical protein